MAEKNAATTDHHDGASNNSADRQRSHETPFGSRSPDAQLGDPTLQLPEVILPGGAMRVSDTAHKLGRLLAKNGQYFVRGGALVKLGHRNRVPILQAIKPAMLPSVFESVARLRKLKREVVEAATCNEQSAKLILHAEPFLNCLPAICVVTSCPVLIERDGQLVQVTDFDRESGILASGDTMPDISLSEARRRLDLLIADFRFATPSDRSRALAALITPALVLGGLLGARTPVDLGEADESQAGKGYRNKITAAVYRQTVRTVTQRKGGVGSLEESFNAALMQGANFICLDNMRGKIDSPAIESFLTEETYLARIPFSPNMEIDPRYVVVMMTSNRADLTKDFANRSSCVRIVKQPTRYRYVEYPEGDLLDRVQANPEYYLAAIFAMVREWHAAGKRRSREAGHDFRRWAQTLDWIVQDLLDAAPLIAGHREVQDRMSNPALSWLRDVTLAVERAGQTDRWLRTHDLLYIIAEVTDVEVPGLLDDADLEDDRDRSKVLQAMGRKLTRCFSGGTKVNIDAETVERREANDSAGRNIREYRVSRSVPYAPAMESPIDPAIPRIPRMRSELSADVVHTEDSSCKVDGGNAGDSGNAAADGDPIEGGADALDVDDLPADQRDDYEERVASLAYENGFVRKDAEAFALAHIRRQM